MNKKLIFLLALLKITFMVNAQSKLDNQSYLDLNETKFDKNSDLFRIKNENQQQIIVLEGNNYNEKIDEFTGKKIDDASGGKVILFPDVLTNYKMSVDMKFLGCNLKDFPSGGWFGFSMRAQDFENHEVVWFMPGGGGENNTVAYVPIAHGVCPWWSEAYDKQAKGNIQLPKNDWFTAQIEVIGDEFTVRVNDEFVFTKKLSYYLVKGKAGLFVGTATDVAFKNVSITKL